MKYFIFLLILMAANSCGLDQAATTNEVNETREAKLSQPKEAAISLEGLCIDEFTADKILTLKRYFSGNPRWEILQERGHTYAIRKEKENGWYQTSMNGYYSNFSDTTVYHTRVIVSFGKYYGYGNDESPITFTDSKNKTLQTTVQEGTNGRPIKLSYLVIQGKAINLEIFEEAKNTNRTFTQKTLTEVNTELANVLKYKKDIDETGSMPIAGYYPCKFDSTFLTILDGQQPGIYRVQASLKTKGDGIIYTRVFDNKLNKQLSINRITPQTLREAWTGQKQEFFFYESELVVYEGDWDHEYEARFEIWYRDKKGAEEKLAEKVRLIRGWQM